jgi:hypothetical protein
LDSQPVSLQNGFLQLAFHARRSVAQRCATMGTGVRATMGPAAFQRRATMRTVPIVAGVHTERGRGPMRTRWIRHFLWHGIVLGSSPRIGDLSRWRSGAKALYISGENLITNQILNNNLYGEAIFPLRQDNHDVNRENSLSSMTRGHSSLKTLISNSTPP